LARGFLFDDNFAGLVASYKGADFSVPFYWMKAYEGNQDGFPGDKDDFDVDYYAIAPSFSPSETVTVNPYFLWITSDDARDWDADFDELDAYYIGVDLDAKLNAADVWLTAIYQGGEADDITGPTKRSMDFSAWLAAAGASVDLGAANVHGQVFYASGDDDDNDDDIESFEGPEGQSYLWGLIMGHGYGWDDYDEVSAHSPGEEIGNIMAVNIGTTVTPMEKLTVDFDIWYAQLAEDIIPDPTKPNEKEDDLGTEVDIRAAYQLFDNLTFEVVAGYLFAGDATYNGSDDADPYMLGTGLTLEF
ncbi:MAG: alginate export family protein, partial [Deltaproteobacteria bacterium]|nr:alginate export family protein [Deltaproteobacteria bacterium]